jgi:hypothetical protein
LAFTSFPVEDDFCSASPFECFQNSFLSEMESFWQFSGEIGCPLPHLDRSGQVRQAHQETSARSILGPS